MKPILFNTEMTRAILEGRKTVTRRVMKPQPIAAVKTLYRKDRTNIWRTHGADCWYEFRAPCVPGDILWVRETWAKSMAGTFMYRADDKAIMVERWHPSIHMTREAARLFLRVVAVRVERLKDITPEQIDAEGCKEWAYSATTGELLPSGPSWFSIAWDNTLKPADRALYGWAANPWVWVIEFERISMDTAQEGGGTNGASD